jgi:excisionase family DNA binding protein
MTHESAGDDKTRLISMAEAANIYGFSPQYLSELAQKGRLKATRIGRSWATTPADIEDYIRSRQRKGAYRDDIQTED